MVQLTCTLWAHTAGRQGLELVCAGEGQYSLKYGEVGTRVAIVSSEPITASSDWVPLPRNTALIISQAKNGYVSILKSPLAKEGRHPRVEGRPWGAPHASRLPQVHRLKRQRVTCSQGAPASSFHLLSRPAYTMWLCDAHVSYLAVFSHVVKLC